MAFRERAERARAYLRHPRSSFVVVSSADPSNLDDARALARGIRERGVRIDAAVFNRAYEPLAEDPLEVGDRGHARDASAEVVERVWTEPETADAVVTRLVAGMSRVLEEAAAANARAWRTTAGVEIDERAARVFVARLEEDIRDLRGLHRLAPRSARRPRGV